MNIDREIDIILLALFISIIKLLQLLRFNEKIGLLSQVLKTVSGQMSGMILGFVIVIAAHAQFLNMIYGNFYDGYSSYIRTVTFG